MSTMRASPGKKRIVHRDTIFHDVLKMYEVQEGIVKEFPTFIQFQDELAIDAGGVSREMFSAFWEKAYSLICDGANFVVPLIHPQTDIAILPIMGKVISHGYLSSGCLPVRIALPSLIGILLGTCLDLPHPILLGALLDYVSCNERTKLQLALTYQESDQFPEGLEDVLILILSRLGCRTMPTTQNIAELIIGVAKYEFCCKPAAAISLINAGIPEEHRKFWKNLGVDGIACLYNCLTVTNDKVLDLLCCTCKSPAEERVQGYLITLIGNLGSGGLRNFLRFVTGSSVCISSQILVTFTSSRQMPFAGTCGYSLELPSSFTNYDEFHEVWFSILEDTGNQWKWKMAD